VTPFKASPAMLLVPSLDGTGLVSFHTPANWPFGLVTKTALAIPVQLVVPAATPWQYCVVELMSRLVHLQGVDHPGANRGGVRQGNVQRQHGETDNPTSKVRRMVLLPPAVMAPPRRSRVFIDGGAPSVNRCGEDL